jgi:hypothetical protein
MAQIFHWDEQFLAMIYVVIALVGPALIVLLDDGKIRSKL